MIFRNLANSQSSSSEFGKGFLPQFRPKFTFRMWPARQTTPRRQKLVIKIPVSASCMTKDSPRIRPPGEAANPARAPRPATGRGGAPLCSPRFNHLWFDTPAAPSFILENFLGFLTSLEEAEILNYPEIYYIRTREPADRELNPVTPSHFQFVTSEHIAFRFQMQKVLGKGAFGGVLKCIDHKTGEEVAIKMLRDHPKHHDQITLEFNFLNTLQSNQNSTVIRLIETFTFHGFFCFVLELFADIRSVSGAEGSEFCGFFNGHCPGGLPPHCRGSRLHPFA
jgi:hypothetical protein